MADELIDVYDENNEPIGAQVMKSEAHRKGLFHRAIHVWIYNSKGEMLLQLRAKDKILFPNMWDVAVGGHVGAGEKPIISALREMEEEIGIVATEEDLEFLKIEIKRHDLPHMLDYEHHYEYLMKYDGDIKNLNLQTDEVAGIKWVSLNLLEDNIKQDSTQYVDGDILWIEIINIIKDKVGS